VYLAYVQAKPKTEFKWENISVVLCYPSVFTIVMVYAIVHRLLCTKSSGKQSEVFLIEN